MSRMAIKVLSVCAADNRGGAARAAYRIHQSQLRQGIDSRMLVKYKSSDDATVIPLDTLTPHNRLHKAAEWMRNKYQNQLQHHWWRQYPDREKIYMSDLRGCDTYGAFKKIDYDVLHLHWINQRFVSLNQLPTNKPIVWTLHDSWPFCGVCHTFLDCSRYQDRCGRCPLLHSEHDNDLSRTVWQKKHDIYKRLNMHIVTPSEWLGACAKKSGLFEQFPVTVIPNCLDVTVFRPYSYEEISSRWETIRDGKKGKRYILYGAFNAVRDKIKGYQHLLSALRLLSERGYGNDIELIVFGAGKSELSMDLGIPVHYVGRVSQEDELVSLYNLADVVVVPSLSENLSCTIMESLSCETPVLAFNIGGNGDMISHKRNGYLAHPYDVEDFAMGVMWCLNNNAGNSLGVDGRNKVVEKYTYTIVGEKYRQLYESLMNA